MKMKLAEALILRADIQKRIEQLRSRLTDNAKEQEGEKPGEGRAGRGLGEDATLGCQNPLSLQDLLVGDRVERAAGLRDRRAGKGGADGVADAYGRGDRLGIRAG